MMVLLLGANATVAVENMEVWGTPDLKSDSPTVATAGMFHKFHPNAVGMFRLNGRKLL